MKISEKWLLAAACLFAGVILGFLLAPIKKGIYCGNYSGNRYGNLPRQLFPGQANGAHQLPGLPLHRCQIAHPLLGVALPVAADPPGDLLVRKAVLPGVHHLGVPQGLPEGGQVLRHKRPQQQPRRLQLEHRPLLIQKHSRKRTSAAVCLVDLSGNYFMPKRFLNRSTRPPVSTSFCRPVKNGWHLEQISTRIFSLVDRVWMTSPQAQVMVVSTYFGWIPSFTCFTSFWHRL